MPRLVRKKIIGNIHLCTWIMSLTSYVIIDLLLEKRKKKKSGLISRITKSCNGTTVSCGKDLHLATVYICCQASSSLQDACQ